VSVVMSLLAMLEEGPSYGLALHDKFEARTGRIWPLNVGQVYTTLARLERDGLVRLDADASSEAQKLYEITSAGRARVRQWFARELAGPAQAPARDELVLKLVMSVRAPDVHPIDVIQAERRAAVELLQEYTRLKLEAGAGGDTGWLMLVDSFIFQAEARVRWLDACESHIERAGAAESIGVPAAESSKVTQ
jgi:DNA-binding PadR family transcriptional regulator